MAIHCIFGLPGAGKTTALTMLGTNNICGKSPGLGLPHHTYTFANFELAGAYKLDFSALGLYLFEDALILIDEIMLLADSREFKTFPEHLKYFFSHHRKYNLTIVYCSQSWENMDKRIRELTDHYYLLSPFIGGFSVIKPIVHHFDVKNGCIDDGYTLGAPLTWKFCFRPKYYKLFDTLFGVKDLPPVEMELWKEYPYPKTYKEKLYSTFQHLTDWGKSPVLRAVHRFPGFWLRVTDWGKSPVLRAARSVAESITSRAQRVKLRVARPNKKNCI